MVNNQSFEERIGNIIFTFVKKDGGSKFINTRELAEKPEISLFNISNFITGRTQTPDLNVLSKLSLV